MSRGDVRKGKKKKTKVGRGLFEQYVGDFLAHGYQPYGFQMRVTFRSR